MERTPVTIEQVREAQKHCRDGVSLHEAERYEESIELFRKCVSINPRGHERLKELSVKLKRGSFERLQESVAYMGFAALHLHSLIAELSDDKKEQVPVDPLLRDVLGELGDDV
ncbi:MAG: tetratricopeptide repeat protein [Nitrospinales bacterium]